MKTLAKSFTGTIGVMLAIVFCLILTCIGSVVFGTILQVQGIVTATPFP